MKLKPRLLFYVEQESAFNNKIRAEFFKHSLPFTEIYEKAELVTALISRNFNVIISISSKNLYDEIVKVIDKENLPLQSFLIVSELADLGGEKCDYAHGLDELVKHVLTLAINHSVNMQPQQPSIIHKIMAMEMEKIGISKSYIGFKYFLDLLVININDKKHDLDLRERFEKIALINNINKECIERDLRHMLNSCWKNSEIFRNAISNVNGNPFVVNFKNLLNATLQYFVNLF